MPPPRDHDEDDRRQEQNWRDRESVRDLAISFDVRDLLSEIRADVKAIRLDQSSANDRLTKLEGRVDTLDAVAKSKSALIATGFTLIVMLVAVGGLLLRIGGS